MPPKRSREAPSTSRGKGKASSSSTPARSRGVDESGIRRFLSPEHKIRFEHVVTKWTVLPERQVILEDFPGFEIETLIHRAGWNKVIAKPFAIYPTLVQEFYTNFNFSIDEPGTDHEHHTWVRDKWILFTPEVIDEYLELNRDGIIPIPLEQNWPELAQVLYGRADAWPLRRPHFLYKHLTESLMVLMMFICHNVDPSKHRNKFDHTKAALLYHLARGLKIDLGTHIYNLICARAAEEDIRHSLLFPSLICGICRAYGVRLLPAEQPMRPAASINIHTARNSWRKVSQYRRGRQDDEDDEGNEFDDDLHPAPQQEPPENNPVLRQMFATMTGVTRDVQQLQQSFMSMDLRIQDMQTDSGIVRANSSRSQEEISTLRRSTERLTGRLDRYTGIMDGMQIRVDQTYDMAHHMQAEMGQQSALMREILSRLPPPPPSD